ncbi:hypothetical protein [Phaeobacter porticola]|uniref:Uncharacterized protein n=1 Tax=Phaeobacter porticola TaxID=1844006 RepID=A0A1L3I4T6_9RHOB|nr:hypothetical protein [Phaeobacter porticola]APG47089.1 hypothetical protein PhaeoP97_01672 [Phaeobacter porticola]
MAKVTVPGKWPPVANVSSKTPRAWLRYERQYPGSRRPSRLIAHPTTPYIASATVGGSDGKVDLAALSKAAEHYLTQLNAYVNAAKPPLGETDPMLAMLADVASSRSLLRWCDIWPQIDGPLSRLQGQIASWNLSRNDGGALPATIILVATEGLENPMMPAFFLRFPSAGFRVPIEIRKTAAGYDLIIRGLTAEFPGGDNSTLSSLLAESSDAERQRILTGLTQSLSGVPVGFLPGDGSVADTMPTSATEPLNTADQPVGASGENDAPVASTAARASVGRMLSLLDEDIAKRSGVEASSLLLRDIQFSADPANVADGAWEMTLTLLARGLETPRHSPLSYRLTVRVRMDDPGQNSVELVSIKRAPLVSHAVAGGGLPPIAPFVRVFPVPPPDWRAAVAPDHPSPPLAWRRPTREDSVLDLFRETVAIEIGTGLKMQQPAYVVRNCPRFVPGDGDSNLPKALPPMDVTNVPPRRNLSSAISAYWNSKAFFDSMRGMGITPESYVATADGPLSVHYRSGIVPGPGRNGRTINAQVRYEVAVNAAIQSKPSIDMHLALANLNRWARVGAGTPQSQLEPLGFASSGRWMLHEFGHYLLAARIGQLEFDFAHSAGDALAAVYFDPLSDLSSPTYAGDPKMRGWTFPFIFAPRRHDRTPALGWGWYGLLNRSVVEDPPPSGTEHKAYLTEQILSSSIFLLYRALGGDTLSGDEADWAQRTRASDMTLYLLMQALAGLAQSPSRAEMLESGMEAAGWSAPALVPLPRGGADWAPATSHKVARWAFEIMGMFPDDPALVSSEAGAPPLVDLYIRDRRAEVFPTGDGPVQVGAGSYLPVSLHWAANADWTMPTLLPTIGNRGSVTANATTLRLWAGWVLEDQPLARVMDRSVQWLAQTLDLTLPGITATQVQELSDSDEQQITQLVTSARNTAAPGLQLVVLVEVSQVEDRANTDPAAGLTLAIGAGDSPPQKVQALVDLVANDNNLGLRILI